MQSDLAQRYAKVNAEIAAAAKAAQVRLPRLLAVSKGQDAEAIRALYGLGHREFGENYVQELSAKAAALADLKDLRWVYIGRLQSNKFALLAKIVSAVQSLGSERHAQLLARAWREAGRSGALPVHLLVNAGDEATKDGVNLAAVPDLARHISSACPELRVAGLMALPPPLPTDAPRSAPALYKELRALATQVGDGELSLGMSGDLWQAVAAGSDCVRIGTALFGARAPRPG